MVNCSGREFYVCNTSGETSVQIKSLQNQNISAVYRRCRHFRGTLKLTTFAFPFEWNAKKLRKPAIHTPAASPNASTHRPCYADPLLALSYQASKVLSALPEQWTSPRYCRCVWRLLVESKEAPLLRSEKIVIWAKTSEEERPVVICTWLQQIRSIVLTQWESNKGLNTLCYHLTSS